MSTPPIASRIDHALARGHWVLAACAWSKQQRKRAGVELKFACQYAERAASRIGRVVKPMVDSALVTAEKLETQSPCPPDEVVAALLALGDVMNALDRHVVGSEAVANVFDSPEIAAKSAAPVAGRC